MEITIDNHIFTSTHRHYRGVITLYASIGSRATSLISFGVDPSFEFEDFNENREIFKKLLIEFFKQPKSFIDHWLCYNPINKTNEWISKTELWGLEFRMSDNGNSDPWILFYMNDDNPELKQLSIDFKNNFK